MTFKDYPLIPPHMLAYKHVNMHHVSFYCTFMPEIDWTFSLLVTSCEE